MADTSLRSQGGREWQATGATMTTHAGRLGNLGATAADAFIGIGKGRK
jgi:hypothetical protein